MQELAEASYLLSSYDAQKLSSTIKQLKEQLYSAKGQAAPRRKFAFSKTPKNSAALLETASMSQQHPAANDMQPSTSTPDQALVSLNKNQNRYNLTA